MSKRNPKTYLLLWLASLLVVLPAGSQSVLAMTPDGWDAAVPTMGLLPAHPSEAVLVAPVILPRMAPELALTTYQDRAARQTTAPVSYSASTVIDAELPDTAQRGEYELRRRFIAPHTLQFTPVRFSGDGFVKSNVIVRLLQSEVDHVTKGEGPQTAISEANYKFSYKGVEDLEGRPMHVFHVKPRKKRPGLFKGRILVDAVTGSLRRAEGTLVKSPSFFVKKIEFVQDYADFGGITLPVHVHSVAKTRLVGRAVVEIFTRDYSLEPSAPAEGASSASATLPGSAAGSN